MKESIFNFFSNAQGAFRRAQTSPAKSGSWDDGLHMAIGIPTACCACSAGTKENGAAPRSTAPSRSREMPQHCQATCCIIPIRNTQRLHLENKLLRRSAFAPATGRRRTVVGAIGGVPGRMAICPRVFSTAWIPRRIPRFFYRGFNRLLDTRAPQPPFRARPTFQAAMRAGEISLIISTYQRPDALEKVLRGVAAQLEMPGEEMLPCRRRLRIFDSRRDRAMAAKASIATFLARRPRISQNDHPQQMHCRLLRRICGASGWRLRAAPAVHWRPCGVGGKKLLGAGQALFCAGGIRWEVEANSIWSEIFRPKHYRLAQGDSLAGFP